MNKFDEIVNSILGTRQLVSESTGEYTFDKYSEDRGAVIYKLRRDGVYVLCVTQYRGSSDVVTTYTDPLADGLKVDNNPDQPLDDSFDKKQFRSVEQLRAVLP
jgi:hypothetical protein